MNMFYPILVILTIAAFVITDVYMLKKEFKMKSEAINEIFKNCQL